MLTGYLADLIGDTLDLVSSRLDLGGLDGTWGLNVVNDRRHVHKQPSLEELLDVFWGSAIEERDGEVAVLVLKRQDYLAPDRP